MSSFRGRGFLFVCNVLTLLSFFMAIKSQISSTSIAFIVGENVNCDSAGGVSVSGDDSGHVVSPSPFTDENVSRYILEFLESPTDLLNAASVNQCLLSSLTMDLVVERLFRYGKNYFRSLKNLFPLMERNAIYPVTAFCLLRMIVVPTCYYCRDVREIDRSVCPGVQSSGTYKPVTPGTSLFVRGNFGIRTCHDCLTKQLPREYTPSTGSFEYSSLTREWRKLVWSSRHKQFFHNSYYLAHRRTLFDIFQHPRILCYPYGERFFDINDVDDTFILEQVLAPSVDSIISQDRVEFMWTRLQRNSFGDPVGPIFNQGMLNQLVTYVESENNQGIDYYLDNMIEAPPSPTDYDAFLDAYRAYITRAEASETSRLEDQHCMRLYKMHERINVAIGIVAAVVEQVTPINMHRWHGRTARSFSYYSYDLDCQELHRALLLYHEMPYLQCRYPLTWNTDSPNVNRAIHSAFGPFFKSNKEIEVDEAEPLAKHIWETCSGLIGGEYIFSIHDDRSETGIRTGFVGEMISSRPIWITVPPAFQPWQDTSHNRRL